MAQCFVIRIPRVQKKGGTEVPPLVLLLHVLLYQLPDGRTCVPKIERVDL
jgi:hypothetical protein